MGEFISEEQRAEYVAALHREYAALKSAGVDRVKDVEAELARLGESVGEHESAKPRRSSARKAVSKAVDAAEVRND